MNVSKIIGGRNCDYDSYFENELDVEVSAPDVCDGYITFSLDELKEMVEYVEVMEKRVCRVLEDE